MASLITGFEYDIFISYRQKDNKHDGWVTEFMDNLKGELESTFKEEISVYFDINPHNGLLETHDVDASLKDKLKCLVFIPIISRTYCDPKSFAWEHEFKAFVELASQDQFGLKVKLPNGNVASRILPVQIHDLYPEDKATIEKELGGVLRAIEFIYKEPGVNRPLTGKDNEDKNTNKTNYRNQINKVANAIDEILHTLKGGQTTSFGRSGQSDQPVHSESIKKEPGTSIINRKSKKWLIALLSVLLCIVGLFALFKIIESTKRESDTSKLEKSIAVLPFVNDSPDQENTYFINGIMDEILNNLQKIKDFRVLSRTSTEQYRGANKPAIPKIAKDLNVNYLVEGSGQKYGNTVRLRVQLIAARNEKHLWGESFEQEIKETNDIFKIQSQIAQAIASELEASITPQEKDLIEKVSTTNLTAYDFYQRGNDELWQYFFNNNTRSLNRAEDLFNKALSQDSTYANAFAGLAGVFYGKHSYESSSYFTANYLDSVLILANSAIEYDDHLSEGYFYRALYYLGNGKNEQAIKDFDAAIKYNPNDWNTYLKKGYDIYLNDPQNMDFVKGLDYLYKASSINHGKELPDILITLGDAYGYIAGFPELAKKYFTESFKLTGDSTKYNASIGSLEIQYGDFENGIKKSLAAYSKDSAEWRVGNQYFYHGLYSESLKYYLKEIEKLKTTGKIPFGDGLRIGAAFWQCGYKKEAEYWFNNVKNIGEESIKLSRDYATSSDWGINAYYNLAGLYAFRGEKGKAYEYLKIISRSSIFPYYLVEELKKYNRLFDGIRDEPEFQTILKEMESKYQAEHERVRKWLEQQGKL